jgi:polyisoprenoid-binding protein YceI
MPGAFQSISAGGLVIVLACLAAPPASAAPRHYVVDPTHTFVMVEVLHFGTSTVRARFDHKDGHVEIDFAARTGTARITIDTASVNSGVPDFDKHLRSRDFLRVADHREAVFEGKGFVFDGDRIVRVDGSLTLLGKTHPVSLKAIRFNCYDNPILKAEVCGGDFETTLRRSQWGMNWGIDMGIPDEVRLSIQIEGARD